MAIGDTQGREQGFIQCGQKTPRAFNAGACFLQNSFARPANHLGITAVPN